MEHHETLEILIDAIYNGIIAINKEGIITVCNKAARRMMGVNEDVLGRSVETIIYNARLLSVLKTGVPQYAEKFSYKKKTFLTNVTPIVLDDLVMGAVAVFQEITDIEKIPSELLSVHSLNHELNTIIDSIDDGVLVTDGEGKIIRVNKSIEKVTGLSVQEYTDSSMQSLYEKGLLLYAPIVSAALEKKKIVTNLQIISTGKEVIVTANPVTDKHGKINRVVTTARDITDLNKLKQDLEQSQKLTELYRAQVNQLTKKHFLKNNKVVTRNTKMLNILELCHRIAQTETTVLILGETGVGKELIAENIHNWSDRAEMGPLIEVNCSAIPKELLESEFFGYESGSFTGAKKGGKPGLFELASEGSILLDEIGDLPLEMQAKLLRVLETKQYLRLGGLKHKRINTRFIAATNKDLEEMVKEGLFREDLYYRLNVVPIAIPSLRERLDDIPILLSFFLNKFNQKYGLSKSFCPEAISLLQKYHWPGNVRELKNIIERLVLISSKNIIYKEDIPSNITKAMEKSENAKKTYRLKGQSLKDIREELEITILKEAIEKYGSIREIARELGLSHTAVGKKMRKYNLL
jgi:PAS domain S-box-containing protein/TyrR family helix-turn-helix protein